jgi:hypothetical protein
MEGDNACKDGQIDTERAGWVENAQSPEPAINNTRGFDNCCPISNFAAKELLRFNNFAGWISCQLGFKLGLQSGFRRHRKRQQNGHGNGTHRPASKSESEAGTTYPKGERLGKMGYAGRVSGGIGAPMVLEE